MLRKIVLLLALLVICLATFTVAEASTYTTPDGVYFATINESEARNRSGFWHGFNNLFVQADNPHQFLGEPSVAQIKMPGKDPNFDFYLIAIPFNVPMIKKNPIFHYRYVRLDGSLKVLRHPVHVGKRAELCRVKILSIYPTNSSISATMQSTHLLEETIQPQWSGASAGSIHNANTDVLSYGLQLPTMIGITAPNSDGEYGTQADLRWALYPAKKQQIILGDRLGFALVAVEKITPPATDERQFWFNAGLTYSLTMGPPFSNSHFEEVWQFPLTKAGTMKQLLAAHALDFPSADIAKLLKDEFTKADKDSKFGLSRINGHDAAIFEANSGDVQRIDTDGLTDLPSFSKRWKTLSKASQVWNLVTSYDKGDKTLVCRCTETLPFTEPTVSAATIKLSDSANKAAPQSVVLGITERRHLPGVGGQDAVILEGTTVFDSDDEFEKYDSWELIP